MVVWKSMLYMLRNHQTVFQIGCTILHSLRRRLRALRRPVLTSIWCFSVLDFDRSSTSCAMESDYYFNLNFSDDTWWGASFHVLICLYLFLGEKSAQDFYAFFNWSFAFLLLSFK